MEITLHIHEGELINRDDAQNIESFIDDIIAKHSENSEMMNLMALEATSLVTSVESRSKELESQGILKRSWRELTGVNQKVSARNSRDLAQSQYLGQQMLNKLAENNLMTYQMVVALGDKVNRVAQELNTTREGLIQINQTLVTFFTDVRKKLESKFTSLERNDDLLFWKETMMHEPIYKGQYYEDISKAEKVICLANEFYRHSQQQWKPRDLAFLKSIISQIGHRADDKITLKEICQSYQNDNELLAQLFKGIEQEPDLTQSTELTPTLMAFGKLQSLEGEESSTVETILKYAPDASPNEVTLDLAESFVAKQGGRSLSTEITMFDAVMDIVEDLSIKSQHVALSKDIEPLVLALENQSEEPALKSQEDIFAQLLEDSENNSKLRYWLAQAYLNGWLVDEDNEKAKVLLLLNADNGDHEAQLMLGRFYIEGRGDENANCEEGYKRVKQSAEQANPDAILKLAECYQFGWGVKKNARRAYELISSLTDEYNDYKNVEAFQALGDFFAFENDFVGRNVEEAAKWMRAAADLYPSNENLENRAKNAEDIFLYTRDH